MRKIKITHSLQTKTTTPSPAHLDHTNFPHHLWWAISDNDNILHTNLGKEVRDTILHDISSLYI